MIKAKISGAIKNAEVLHQVALNYMEYVPGGVILINAMTGKILYANARALDIFECESAEQFRDFVGANFRNAILPEDYAKVGEELKEQFQKDSGLTKQISYRTRTRKGKIKRIYHVGRVYKDTPYGHVFSAFVSEDDIAMKNYFTQIMKGVLRRLTSPTSPGCPAIIEAAAQWSAMRGPRRHTPSPPAE